jgi:hypothetical protein
MAPDHRATVRGDVPTSPGAEIAAQAWSYAASVHLALDPEAVFHDAGYRGSAAALRRVFATAGTAAPGAPLLRRLGLTGGAYPKMIRWLNESENES